MANSAMNPFVILYFNLDANNFCHAHGSHSRQASEQSRQASRPRCINGNSRKQLRSQDVTTDHSRHGEPIVTDVDVIADEHVNGQSSLPDSAALSVTPTDHVRMDAIRDLKA